MVQCMTFGWWRNYWSWWTGLLGVVKWQGVGVCLGLQCDKVNHTCGGGEKG